MNQKVKVGIVDAFAKLTEGISLGRLLAPLHELKSISEVWKKGFYD